MARWPPLVHILFAGRLWFLVFCFLDLLVGLLAVRSSEVIVSAKAGESCDLKHDVLLVEESTSDSAYLQCVPIGRGMGGYWKRESCQPGQKFHFTEQKCENNPLYKPHKVSSTALPLMLELTTSESPESSSTSSEVPTTTPPATTSHTYSTPSSTPEIIRVGLNESCANGELCDFGTVCDYVTRLCSCPAGLVQIPNTKLCEFARLSTSATTLDYPTSSTTFAATTTTASEEPETTTTPTTTTATTQRFSISMELFTQETPVYYYTQSIPTYTQASPKLISPGSSCKDAEGQCGGGSYCNRDNDVCSCPVETIDEGGTCVHIKMSAGLNERCDSHTKCAGWSTCINNVCQCQSPLIQNGHQCVPRDGPLHITRESKPNQPCDKGQVCVGGSICSTVTLLCTCPVGSHSNGESCFPLKSYSSVNSSIGQQCDMNSDCIPGAYCSAGTSPPSCQCLSTHVFVNEMCHKIINPGLKGCKLDEQCSASYQGARCVMGACSCPSGLVAQAQTCRPVSLNPGDVCQNNEACSGGAVCFHSVCVCPLGFVAFDGKCVTNTTKIHFVPVGGLCMNKKKYVCIDGSECKNGLCRCPENTLLVNATCKKVDGNDTNEALLFPLDNYLGMFLLNFSQVENPPPLSESNCATNNCGKYEICKNAHCQCIDGFLRINGKCRFKYVKVGEACSKEQICLEESECFVNVCTCLPGLKNQGGKCVANRFKIDCPSGMTLVGNHCENVTQEDIAATERICTDIRQCGRGFICLNNKCTCPSGTTAKLGQCWRNPVGSCSNGEVCTGCSVCLRDMCTCPGNVAPISGICPSNTARPNDLCTTGQCCLGGSECVQGICQCPEGTQLLSGDCVQVDATSSPFGSCNNGERCIGGSVCTSGVCLCAVNQMAIANQCQNVPSTYLVPGETCSQLFDLCTGGSVCHKGVCVCPQGQFPVEKLCIPSIPGIPGDSCNDFDPCVVGVLCLQGICHCPNSTIWSVDKCVSIDVNVGPGGVCSSTQHCSGGSICMNSHCACTENQVVVNAQCKSRKVPPNADCQPPQECTGNSQCVKGYCLCSSKAIPIEGECMLAVPLPGDNCSPGFSQCSGGSTCLMGVCVCPTGQQAVNGLCSSSKMSANPGQFCDPVNYVCSGDSVCTENKCTCRSEFTIVHAQCKPKQVPPNSSCQLPQQCTGGAKCIQGSCLCPANSIVNTKGICVSVQPAPEELCDINFSICRGGAVCIQSKCTCQQGQFIINETCVNDYVLILAKPSEFCDSKLYKCIGGALCVNSKCTCPSNNIVIENHCQPSSPSPFQPCKLPQICSGGSSCIDGRCLCPAGKIAINNICQNIPAPGERCSSNLPVCSGGASCINGVCACSLGNNPFNGKCNTAKLGQFCTQDSYHCLDGSMCSIENTCTCPLNKISIDSKCVDKNPQPGSLCVPQQTCSGGSTCVKNVCQCPVGFAPDLSHKCVPLLQNPAPNGICVASQICSGGSTCISGICQCPNNSQPVAGICRTTVQTSVPGESCKDNQVCSGGSICANGVCVCPPNQISKGSVCESASRNNLAPGALCNTDIQCGGGSTCISGKCLCPVNSVVYSNQCILKQVNAGGNCILFVQSCLGGSRCLGSICVCPQSQIALNGVCRIQPSYFVQNVAFGDQKSSNPGEKCNADTKCMNGSRCIQNICQCPHGYRPHKKSCVRFIPHYRSPGSWCQTDDHCLGDSVCRNFYCICPTNTHVINGECKIQNYNKIENGLCLTNNHCLDGFICLSGFCYCIDNTTCQGSGHFTSPPGGSCAALQQCTGGSECRSGWCICPDANMVVINGVCLLSSNTTSLTNAEVISDSNEEESSTSDDKLNPIDNSRHNQNQLANHSPGNRQNQLPGFQQFPQMIVVPQNNLAGGFQPVLQSQIGSQPVLNPGALILSQPLNPSLSVIQPTSVNFGWDSSSVANKAEPSVSSNVFAGKSQNQNSMPLSSSNIFINPSKSSNSSIEKHYARPGAACSLSTVCTGGSKCILGMCLCDDQFEIIGQICVRKVPPMVASPPMGSCQNGEACTGGAICDGTICQCLPGTELRINLCQPTHPQTAATTRRPMVSVIVVPPLATCANGEICGGNSVCNRLTFICECIGDMQPMQGHCLHLLNRNKTPIQNTQPVPVASAWHNTVAGPKSEIYKPTIYALSMNNDNAENPKPVVSTQNIYGSFIPSANGDQVEKPNVIANNPNVLPPPIVNTITKSDSSPTVNVPEVGSPPNGPCGRGLVCTGGSYCVHLKCRCPEGSVVNEYDICQVAATSNAEKPSGPKRLGGLCQSEKDCAGSAICISGRCRCPPNTIQDGPVCISLKDSGKQRFFAAPILHADATSLCPQGAEPIKESDADNYIECNASRPSSCPPGWYCYATDKALEEGPYYCCPV